MTLSIRASSLPSYSDCPRRAAVRMFRVELEDAGYEFRQTVRGVGPVIGTAFHAGSKAVLDAKVTGERVSQSDAAEIAIVNFRENLPSEPTEWDKTTPRPNDAERQLQTMQAAVAPTLASLTPAVIDGKPATELGRSAVLDLPEIGVTVKTTGHIDLETDAGAILDEKTGRMRNHYGQMGLYSLHRKSETGKSATGLRIIQVPRVPVSKPYPGVSVHEYPVAVCEKTAWFTIQYILRDFRQFERTGSPWAFAANPMSMLCTDKFCPARGTAWCEMKGAV